MYMKDHILAALREELAQWEALLAGMSEAQRVAPHLPGSWSTKDEIAHLRAWQQRSIARLEAAQRGDEPEFPAWPVTLDPNSEESIGQLNEWLFVSARDLPWATVHQQWREGYLHFLAMAEAISERDLLDSSKYPWMEGRPLALVLLSSYDHHQEHLDGLIAWLAGT
jgi:hypothetical protein